MRIAISGSVATGKTTLAKNLSRESNHIYLDISSMIKREKLFCDYDKKRKCYIVDEKYLIKRLRPILKNNSNIIIDSHLSHLIPSNLIDLCIITKCNLKKLNKRLEKRNYSKSKIKDNLEAEIFEVCLTEAQKKNHNIKSIDTSKHINVKDLIKEIKLKKYKLDCKKLIIKTKKENLYLRTLCQKDMNKLNRIARDISVREHTNIKSPIRNATLEKFILMTHENIVNRSSINLGIFYKNKLVGMTGLFNIKKESAELGYWIGENYRNKYFALYSTLSLIKYAKKNLKLKKIIAIVKESNIASQNLLYKLGFRKTTAKITKDKKKKLYFRIDLK